MGLFSTLNSSESIKTSSLDLPTVIQLYTSTPFRLEPTVLTPSYALLTFQAVQVDAATDTAVEQKGLRNKKEDYVVPDLGVWNCFVASRSAGNKQVLTDLLLQLPSKVSTFVFTVDLNDLTQVETSLTLQQEALVRYLIAKKVDETSLHPETATTNLFQLRSVQFGLAPNDDEAAESLTKAAPDETDRDRFVTIMISAKMPPHNADDYREKQSLALVMYHLRRYAAALNASLCLVGYSGTTDQQPELSLPQLAFCWRELAQGNHCWLSEEWKTQPQTGEATEKEASPYSMVYGPGMHNTDLIESVLLRNASYPGHWDAAKQSIWKILVPSNASNTVKAKESLPTGDEHWLKELRQSIAAETIKTPPPKKTTGNEAEKTPNDAAVSSFFENLLK